LEIRNPKQFQITKTANDRNVWDIRIWFFRSVSDFEFRISYLTSVSTFNTSDAMYHVSREIEFCYGHRLLNYVGKCRHLHGHNGRVVVTFEASELDDQGMVLDFSEIKRTVSRWIDDHLDHRMILNRSDPAVPLLQALGEPMYLVDVNPTAENIARVIFDVARELGFPAVDVCLWETPRCCARYRPGRAAGD
jgi:6-pyruvoyltetrahydropterin/6-carboxytetrahydropterin synthase